LRLHGKTDARRVCRAAGREGRIKTILNKRAAEPECVEEKRIKKEGRFARLENVSYKGCNAAEEKEGRPAEYLEGKIGKNLRLRSARNNHKERSVEAGEHTAAV